MSVRSTLLILSSLVAATSLAAAGSAQTPEPILEPVGVPGDRAAWRTEARDSARAFAAVRTAQSRFESVRRNHLPWTWSGGGGRCDERIGRFCLWHTDGESKWEPPPDPVPVQDARASLIARLDTAAAVVPGDPWIAGQRVRYLLEAERADEAVAAARACRGASDGWCDALLGYALHQRGDYAAAENAFDAALRRMPERERERWTDISWLLEPDGLRVYRRLEGEARAEFEATFWWLADPFHMLPGNDRRSEHFARQVFDRMQHRAQGTEGISWGDDLREILTRYGAPAGWERMRSSSPARDRDGILTRYPRGGRHFDPPPRFVEDPFAIPQDGWDLNPTVSRSGYAPAYASPVDELEYQIVTYRRADSLVVVAAVIPPQDSLGVRHESEVAMVLWTDRTAPPLVVRGRAGAEPAVLTAMVGTEPVLVSLEAMSRESRRGARQRFGLALGPPPAHGLSVSDLLLLDGAEAASLEDAAGRALAGHRVRPGQRIGLFWEIYGLSRADLPVAVDIRILPERQGLLRRAAVRIGLARDRSPLAVRWREAPTEPGEVHPRSVVIEVPRVPDGMYRLSVDLTPSGRETIRLERVLEVRAD
jgi:hypothetical protein